MIFRPSYFSEISLTIQTTAFTTNMPLQTPLAKKIKKQLTTNPQKQKKNQNNNKISYLTNYYGVTIAIVFVCIDGTLLGVTYILCTTLIRK